MFQKNVGKKFNSKLKKCIMLGYAQTGYTLRDLEKQKLIIARDLIFNENEFWYKKRDDECFNKTEINEQDDTENVGIDTENDENENEVIK